VKVRRGTIVPTFLAAGLLAAGCGSAPSSGSPSASSSAESVAHVLPAMEAAADSAQSVHLTGTVPVGSQTDAINMSLAVPNSVSGSITQRGDTLTLVVADGSYYVEISTGLLKYANISPPDCGNLCGKYVEIPASEASQIAGDLSIQKLFDDAFGAIPPSARKSTVDVFEPTTYHGQPALQATIAGDTMIVARGATPYVLRVYDNNGDSLVFSEWNSVPPITPPPASDVVSPADLGGL